MARSTCAPASRACSLSHTTTGTTRSSTTAARMVAGDRAGVRRTSSADQGQEQRAIRRGHREPQSSVPFDLRRSQVLQARLGGRLDVPRVHRQAGRSGRAPSFGRDRRFLLGECQRRSLGRHLPLGEECSAGREAARSYLLGAIDSFWTPSTVLYRASLVRATDAFFPGSAPSADLEACLNCLKQSDLGFVHQILSFERVHDEGDHREGSRDEQPCSSTE